MGVVDASTIKPEHVAKAPEVLLAGLWERDGNGRERPSSGYCMLLRFKPSVLDYETDSFFANPWCRAAGQRVDLELSLERSQS